MVARKEPDKDDAAGDDPVVMFVRLLQGLIGETRREVHIVPVPSPAEMPQTLTAYCGTRFVPGTAEILPGFLGMPCVLCVARAPIPNNKQLTEGTTT